MTDEIYGEPGSRFSKRSVAQDVIKDVDLTGKTYMITGANCGIGFETAKALALQGAHVVLACRNIITASESKDMILDEKEDAKVDIIKLDLNELISVEECAQTFKNSKIPLHGLILNAGLLKPIHKVTDDGFETTFQINHLSQFYLTELLTPCLEVAKPSARIVVVSSEAHK